MPSSNEIYGWLLDIYPDPVEGVILWFLDEDGIQRHRLHQPFPTSFYVHGPSGDLRSLWRHLKSLPEPLQLSRAEKQDLFVEKPLPVLKIMTETPPAQERLFNQLKRSFPGLVYYNADISVDLRYAAQTGVFPLARCRVLATDEFQVCWSTMSILIKGPFQRRDYLRRLSYVLSIVPQALDCF